MVVGRIEGFQLGAMDGLSDGELLFVLVGFAEGSLEGKCVGFPLGLPLGISEMN